ncbi:MAG TPA: cbb3-type cytochrome c oxidase subunit I [Dehalococcoidia bacterium]|jgi:cytochrome c oxidase subunit 1|nr:cbb3-type cytochrome c oxidase subunit I [Dehalococcoidia bacterium]
MAQLGFLEKWTLRFAVVGLLFLALSGLEGVLMRIDLVNEEALLGLQGALNVIRPLGQGASPAEYFYATLTAHPIVGIYGFAYMAIMGAFYFLVPFLLKKEIRFKKLVPVNFFLQIAGVLICWAAGFFLLFNGLYTLYWPLPVSFDRVPVAGTAMFGFGLLLIEINILIFVFNLFATVLRRSNPSPGYSLRRYLMEAFGLSRLVRFLLRKEKSEDDLRYEEMPVFIVAVGRGSIDTVINAFVLLTAGALLVIYAVPALAAGLYLNPQAIDPLIYKNWFWWGLDMVADGNVLMYTAGTWYLLVPLLVGRKLYGESVVRTVILADLLISLGVWSHHLLADQPQPAFLRLLSGQFITWGEFLTMGLTIFAVMMTIWLARPVKFTPPLKFIMGSIFSFAVGGVAGVFQANYGLNVVAHNTQLIVGPHAHTMLLGGLAMLIFAVIYALIPMLTKIEIPNSRWVDVHLWGWLLGAFGMTSAMGWAGNLGMLRRTLYPDGAYQPEMVVALISSLLMAIAFASFLINIIRSLGWRNVLSLFIPQGRQVSPSPPSVT